MKNPRTENLRRGTIQKNGLVWAQLVLSLMSASYCHCSIRGGHTVCVISENERIQQRKAFMSEAEQYAHTARKVLLLVSELHLRGCQMLRACLMLSPSGTSWRCSIAPASLVSAANGALMSAGTWDSPLVAHYTSAAGAEYFGWTDAALDTPSGLAHKFMKRFPQIVEAGRGSDWLYAGWYIEMLHLTYPNRFPYAMADWDWEIPKGYMPTMVVGAGEPVQIPLPPPGLAAH
jgi:hypothetical protein